MNKNAALIVIASVVLVNQISGALALGPVNAVLKYSQVVQTATIASKIRMESYPNSTGGIEFCAMWMQFNNITGYARYFYNFTGIPTRKGVVNPPPPSQPYKDIDVVDGTQECNVVAMGSKSWYISGQALKNYTTLTDTYEAIGVSNLDSGFKVLIRNGQTIDPFTASFMDRFETKRLSAFPSKSSSFLGTTILVAGIVGGDLYIGVVNGSTPSTIGQYTVQAKPSSISMAVYSPTNWVVCAVTLQFECVFSRNSTVFAQTLSTPFSPSGPSIAAISFVDCNNLAYVVASATKYFLNLVDVSTVTINSGGYTSALTTAITAISMATTQMVTSVIVSNSTNIYLDLFTWPYTPTCPEPPVTTPAFGITPNSAPFMSPTGSSIPQNGPSSISTPYSDTPSGNNANVEGPKGDNNNPSGGVDPIALGVGIAVPVAVLGAVAFLLAFFLRRRRNKKNQDKTVSNPVNNVDNTSQPTEPGVYGNIPSANTTNKTNTYTSIGNITNNNDSFTTASAAIELPEIDKRLHIPYKSLVFIKEIGAGSYGKVFLGEWRGAKVAIKVNNQITDVDGFLAEAKLTLGIAPHPNLVQTFGVSLDGPNPCIVLEYCGGGSLDLLLYDNSAELSAAKQREFAMKIAYGLLHLHNNNIVHRDLAARNILLTADQQPKISDFGMSRMVRDEASKGQTKTSFGPIRWMAPESLRDRSYSAKSDVWTYGIVVNEIISRTEPHVNEDQLNIAVKIRDQAVTPEIPSDADPALVEVIHKCLKADAKDRPTMEELCQFLRSKLD